MLHQRARPDSRVGAGMVQRRGFLRIVPVLPDGPREAQRPNNDQQNVHYPVLARCYFVLLHRELPGMKARATAQRRPGRGGCGRLARGRSGDAQAALQAQQHGFYLVGKGVDLLQAGAGLLDVAALIASG